MKSIKQEKGKLKGKKVLLRLDLNVPVRDGKVLNDFRIKKTFTDNKIFERGGSKNNYYQPYWER